MVLAFSTPFSSANETSSAGGHFDLCRLRLFYTYVAMIGFLRAAPSAGIGKHEHIQTGEQEQKKREQWRVDDPSGRLPQSHGDEVGDDGRRKGDGQPAVNLPNPVIPIQ
jgi:hypothetical protein